MDNPILNKRNCHRAKVVARVDVPEKRPWDFTWRAKQTNVTPMHCDFIHQAKSNGGLVEDISDNNTALNKWVVLEWAYQPNLDDLYERGVRAYSGTSFTPEERAIQYIREYEKMLSEDLDDLPQNSHADYILQFHDRVGNLFDKHSNILSSAITGPAKFPTARNERANNAYETAVKDFNAWRSGYAKKLARQTHDALTPQEQEEEEWQRIKADIEHLAGMIAAIDAGKGTGYNRALFVASLFGKVETIAKNGKANLLDKAIELVRSINNSQKKAVISDRHKFWKLPEVCKAAIQEQQERQNMEDVEITFDGGRVVKAYSEDRIQIFHDVKPEPYVINSLKREGFRWSRLNGCWQRQLTTNAFYAVARVTPLSVQEIRDAH